MGPLGHGLYILAGKSLGQRWRSDPLRERRVLLGYDNHHLRVRHTQFPLSHHAVDEEPEAHGLIEGLVKELIHRNAAVEW